MSSFTNIQTGPKSGGRSLYFYEYLPDNQINNYHIEKLKQVYVSLPPNSFVRFNILERFYKYDPSIYYDIINSISKKLDDNKYKIRLIFHIPGILKKLNNDYTLLKRIYLFSCNIDDHSDYNGETMQQLLEIDSNFIIEYLDWLKDKYEKDYLSSHISGKQYKFIWKMNNYEEIMDNVIKYFSDEDENSIMRLNTNWHYINKLFGIDKSKEKDFIKRIITSNIDNKNIIQLIFIPITNIYFSESVEFVEVLLMHNKDIDTFKAIDFRRGGRVTSNDEKDIEDTIKIWESFLPFTNSLEFIEHRQYISSVIEAYKGRLESERRRKYLNER